jgi:predicted SAM-dependent methyltransferase
MNLEIAAGQNPQQLGTDWLRHDQLPLDGIDMVCDWRRIPDMMFFYFKLTGFDAIYNRHFIEHLDPEEGLQFLELCHSILNRGGRLTVLCPNMEWLCKKYLAGEYTDVSEFVCWMYGGGDDAAWSFHKAGYDCDLLCRLMRQVGFGMFRVVSHKFLLEVQGVRS